MLVVILLTTSGMIPEVVERRCYVESAVPTGTILKDDERVAKAEPPLTIRRSGFLLNTTPAKSVSNSGSNGRRPEQKPSLYG